MLAIPRGIIYHHWWLDLKSLVQSIFADLNDRGPVEEFEQEFARRNESAFCVAFPFARTAIYFALRSRNLPPGSEILMPPVTIKAILDVVLDLGLIPVFVDIDPDTLCFDPEELRAAIRPQTRAVLITYLFGMVPDVEHMASLCREKGLFVVEDFSQCLNGRCGTKKVGNFGDVGVFSASSTKTLDTYGGGLLVCNDPGIHDALRDCQKQLTPAIRKDLIGRILTDLVRNLATSRWIFHVVVFPLIRLLAVLRPGDMLKHTGARSAQPIESLPGAWFAAFTAFQARVGLQLIAGVAGKDAQRASNVSLVKQLAGNARFPKGAKECQNVYWQLVAYVEEPQDAQRFLHARRVDTATTSLQVIAAFPEYPFQGIVTNARRLHDCALFVPAHPGLSRTELQHIGSTLQELAEAS